MIWCAKLSVFVVFAIAAVNSMPANDFVFRDSDDSEGYLSLNDENQILPASEPKLAPDGNEVFDVGLEHGEYFQGDIMLVQDQMDYLLANDSSGGSVPTRTGWIDEFYRWPKDSNGFVILPYHISVKSEFSAYQQSVMRQGMKDIEKHTCIRFVKRTNQVDFVDVISDKGCYSHLGKIGGRQSLSLNKNGCVYKGIVMHEFIHALGYDHMHSHAERDKYIEIMWNNINPKTIPNFDKVDPTKFSNFGTGYDLYSVMHYDSVAFSKNKKPTIVPRNRRYKNIIGQRAGLSTGDAARLNNMYKCKKSGGQVVYEITI